MKLSVPTITAANLQSVAWWRGLVDPGKRRELVAVLVGVLACVLVVWYVVPDILVAIFDTVVGNAVLLLVAVYLCLFSGWKWAVVYLLVWVVVARFVARVRDECGGGGGGGGGGGAVSREPFAGWSGGVGGGAWTPEQVSAFVSMQPLWNPGVKFDMDRVQAQTTGLEAAYYLEHGSWPWDPAVVALYRDALDHNVFVSHFWQDGLRHAQKIYNQAAVLEVLGLQSKEGQFLARGVAAVGDVGADVSGGGVDGNGGVDGPFVRCGLADSGSGLVPRLIWPSIMGGNDASGGTAIALADLPDVVPGFRFLDAGAGGDAPCNPCVGLSGDNSCPFEIAIAAPPRGVVAWPAAFPQTGVSAVWQYLWGVKSDGSAVDAADVPAVMNINVRGKFVAQ